MCLRRFAYPCRYADFVQPFGRSVPQLCMMCTLVVDDISNRFSHLLTDLDQQWLSRDYLKSFAAAVHNKGAALETC